MFVRALCKQRLVLAFHANYRGCVWIRIVGTVSVCEMTGLAYWPPSVALGLASAAVLTCGGGEQMQAGGKFDWHDRDLQATVTWARFSRAATPSILLRSLNYFPMLWRAKIVSGRSPACRPRRFLDRPLCSLLSFGSSRVCVGHGGGQGSLGGVGAYSESEEVALACSSIAWSL